MAENKTEEMDNKQPQELLSGPQGKKWWKIGVKRRAGLLVPLFSVYSKESAGIGDFEDFKLLVDFCSKTSNSILQLLPMNETGLTNCPYDALSSFALDPIYLSLSSIKDAAVKIPPKEIQQIKNQFPTGRRFVNYSVREAKLNLLHRLFDERAASNIKEFSAFREKNSYWLEDFALYKALKNSHQGKAWYEWEEQYKNRNPQALKEFRNTRARDILFQSWIQWHLFAQFKKAKAYAKEEGVFINGDLPILVSRDSSDVWQNPQYFKLGFSAGAPPDMYCAKGQRWGMPTYNWDKIAEDGYRYLKEKLRYAQEFYDILRIDHVVGLFRIWSIPFNEPQENQGLNGFFDPIDENIWENHGRKLLSVMIKSTDMLLCAEDLGIIPACCPNVLRELGIPGSDVQRWVKDWDTRHDFLMPDEYRFLSAAVLSTHDTTNWAAWWENEAGTVDEALFKRKCAERGVDFNGIKERLFNAGLSNHGRLRWLSGLDSEEKLASILNLPKDKITDFIGIYLNTFAEKEKLWKLLGMKGKINENAACPLMKAAIKQTLDSNAVFCIQLIIDWLSLAGIFNYDFYAYRVNLPGTVSPQNWSLVLPVPLEKIFSHRIGREMKTLIEGAARD